MRTCKVIISKEAPGQRDTLWLKPEGNSFVAYLLNGTRLVSLELVDNNDTATLVDDAVAESTKKLKASLVGRNNDTKNSNTINGAKKYADDAVANLIKSGTFSNVPESPEVGTQYFCTNKQTEEGQTDGVMIYWNGTAWVDALGRAIV